MFSLKRMLAGDEDAKVLKRLAPLVSRINELESEVAGLEDGDLYGKTDVFKGRLLNGETLDDILPEAFAVVRETAKRTLGQRHFDVQLMGGIILHRGNIAEMKTGEGKTLVATLPAYLNALLGQGVHIVTVNDYLSRRDAVWMGQVYHALGLTVAVINHDQSLAYDPDAIPEDEEETDDKARDEVGSFKVVHDYLRPISRREAYAADITYGTNSEFGFDYLRDNIEYRAENVRQRAPALSDDVSHSDGHHFAIVDEIDSILIDEARTPLIISAPSAESENLYVSFARIAAGLLPEKDYTIDEKLRAISLSDDGIEKAEKILGVDNIYTEKGIKYVHHLETAVRAKALFEKDKEYVVRDGQVVIVDEFTGRLQPGRRWSEGLHQAIEAKEGVPIQRESRTFASITYQNYFRMYDKLSGMTGTAKTSSEEFFKVYGLETVAVPTNRPNARLDRGDLIFQTEEGKFKAISRSVKELHDKGQPVLIGTVSIEKNELLSAYLKREGIPHEVLNAKKHEQEGGVIAQAGQKGRVTIATNMAGRGVDIKIGGNPGTDEAYEEVKALGGLFVLGTERHEARRIDNQLRGRSGRQGDPGETQFFVSLEDSLMRVFASDMIKRMMGRFGIPEDQPIENTMITRSLETAQEKIEGFNFDARKQVLAYDDVLNLQRTEVYVRRRKILFGSHDDLEGLLSSYTEGDDALLRMIEEKKTSLGEGQFYASLRTLMLQTNDMLWMDHLEMMQYMRSSVNLRAYGQRDPLIEYKKEGLRLFRELEENIVDTILRALPSIGAAPGGFTQERQKLQEVHRDARLIGTSGGSAPIGEPPRPPLAAAGARAGIAATVATKKVGRNDPCPCNSGKKYKKCHGA